ncbi:midnolin [Chanos chanos]|uniref:Midnolin n=1 Tax=Chanos chanos TaxID=29144 RepID=A0A6J2VF24_CHACN|nr:midnolin-like [Chanos chanos]
MDQHSETRSCTSHGPSSHCPELVPSETSMNLFISSTTGTRFELSLPLEETVEGLKRRLSQKLKVPKDRLALLHKDTRLSTGKLLDFGVADGSKLTLVPTVEAGLMSQSSRPEQSIMQALESLTETQVSDFLSGRSPLTLALRVGDHMMFVQLQLAAQQSSGQQHHRHHLSRGPSGAGSTPVGSCGSSSSSSSSNNNNNNTNVGQMRSPHSHHTQSASRLEFPVSSSFSPNARTDQQASPSAHAVPARPCPTLFAGTAPHPHLSSGAGSGVQNAAPPTPCPRADCSTKIPSSSSASRQTRKPGAVIESFVNHAPGVFSGTFSGTLHPNCQDSSGRPRRDISTILQILNDLLSATRHYQGTPPSLAQLRCQTQCTPPSPTPSPPASPTSPTHFSTSTTSDSQTPSHSRLAKPAGEHVRQTENRATRCKVERLQLLMQQRRLRRKARRDTRAPYHWLPNRKAARSHSNSSLSSEGSLDLDFEESVWKPDVQSDMNTEYVMA